MSTFIERLRNESEQLQMTNFYERLAVEAYLGPIIEAYAARFSEIPTFGIPELDKWIEQQPMRWMQEQVERNLQTDLGYAGYVFYKNKRDPKNPIMKLIANVTYLRESNPYSYDEVIANISNTYISNRTNMYVVQHFRLHPWDGELGPDPLEGHVGDVNEAPQDRDDKVTVEYKVLKAGATKPMELGPATQAEIELINKDVREEMQIELYTPMTETGFPRIPIVLFKNQWMGFTMIDKVRNILLSIAKALKELDAAIAAAGPFWVVVTKDGDTMNNKSTLANKFNNVLKDRMTTGERERFVMIQSREVNGRFQTLQEAIGNMSSVPMFEQHLKVLEYWTERLNKTILAPVGTQGNQGVKNQTTSEVTANNSEVDSVISLYRDMRTFEWRELAKMWHMTVGIPVPDEITPVFEGMETQAEKNEKQMAEQADKLGDRKPGKEGTGGKDG